MSIADRRLAAALLVAAFATLTPGISLGNGVRSCIPISNYPNSETEAVWFQHASIAKLNIHRDHRGTDITKAPLEEHDSLFPLEGHDIVGGDTDVLSYRYRFRGWPSLSDTASVALLTILLPQPLIGEGTLEFGQKHAPIAFITIGSPSHKNFCFGYASRGRLSYRTRAASKDPIENQMLDIPFDTIGYEAIWATLSFEAETVSSTGQQDACGPCVFDAQLMFKRKDVGDERH